MKRSVKFAVVTLAVTLFSLPMFAATVSTSSSNNIQASVAAACVVDTPLSINFGAYNPFTGAAIDTGANNVVFRCVKKSNATDTYKIYFSKTAGSMSNGGTGTLAYTLTSTAPAGGAALKTASPGDTVSGTPGAAGSYTFAVYGHIAAGLDPEAGSYNDTVQATIEW